MMPFDDESCNYDLQIKENFLFLVRKDPSINLDSPTMNTFRKTEIPQSFIYIRGHYQANAQLWLAYQLLLKREVNDLLIYNLVLSNLFSRKWDFITESHGIIDTRAVAKGNG